MAALAYDANNNVMRTVEVDLSDLGNPSRTIQTTNTYVFVGRILNNLVYANTNEGLLIRFAQPGSLVLNNTIYQPVGDAIRVQENSTGLRLKSLLKE